MTELEVKRFVANKVDAMLASGRFKEFKGSTPKSIVRFVVDVMPLSEKNLDFYSFLPRLYDSLKEVDKGYSKKLKVLALSIDSSVSIPMVSHIDMDSHYLSVINPGYIRRYRNMAQLSMDLTRKLRHLEALDSDGLLSVSAKGEYVLVSRINISMVLRHLKPTLFGVLIILSLGERIVSIAHTNAYRANPEYNFPYFMVVAANVWGELDIHAPRKKEEFNHRYASLMEILIDLGIKGSEYSTSSHLKIKLMALDLDESYKISKIKSADRLEQGKQNRDDDMNSVYAEAVLRMDEIDYNPNVSKEQRIMNLTGVDLGGAKKLAVSKEENSRREFRQLIESYRPMIVKDGRTEKRSGVAAFNPDAQPIKVKHSDRDSEFRKLLESYRSRIIRED